MSRFGLGRWVVSANFWDESFLPRVVSAKFYGNKHLVSPKGPVLFLIFINDLTKLKCAIFLMIFYINIAQEIGINNQSAVSTATHPSIQAIKENSPKEGYDNFDFEPVS